MGLLSEPPGGGTPEPEPRWTNAFLHLVAHLVARPRRRDRPLPLIWLTGGAGGPVLGALIGYLASPGRSRVPHPRLAVSPSPETQGESETEIRPLLDPLCRQLSQPRFGTGRLRFRR